MRFVILRLLRHNELGVFHSYRRLGKERAKQRAINFDADVVDRVFPAAKDSDKVKITLRYESDHGVQQKDQWLKRQEKNWRLEGNCPDDQCYDFVNPGCLFAMVVDAGVTPAVGSWAVFPADDTVTQSILANAESSGLANHSMISLHDEEGTRTMALLKQSKPDLFDSPDSTAPGTSPGKPVPQRTKNGFDLPPHPKRLVDILAGVGHTLPSAVADIVDNAISHDATEVSIYFGRPDDGHGRWLTVKDNGSGMSEDQLAEAMRIGSDVDYEAEDLGKYGYGLKGASWSQAPWLTVVTRQVKGPSAHLTWDTKSMGSWEALNTPLEPWIVDATKVCDHGTCVFWKDMRPPKGKPVAKGTEPYTAEVLELHRHLGLVFHRFLDGKATGRKKVRITINGVAVESNDPVGHSLTNSYDRKTVRVPTSEQDATVYVQAFLMPSEGEIKSMHGQDAAAIRKDLDRLSMYGKRNESQGVYIYRNQRLIQWGGWHQMWATSDEKTKLARVTVEFGTDLDSQFDVNISKRSVTLSMQLQEEIKKLADPARKDSQKKYLDQNRQKSLKVSIPARSGSTPVIKGGGLVPPTAGTGRSPKGKDELSGGASSTAIPVRPVVTSTFLWKISTNMTGGKEIQVNQNEQELHNLVMSVVDDHEALTSLTGFLERLDQAGVQKILLQMDQK